MKPSASPKGDDNEEMMCSSSSSSLPLTPTQRHQNRRHAPTAAIIGDLATRLEGWQHPDDRVSADGVRLPSTKYARASWRPRRGDFKSQRPPARPNVVVPFATEPSALREFLWGKEKLKDV